MMSRLLTGLIFVSLAALLASLAMQTAAALVWRHVLFAIGIMPLILGAMLYFIPVLSRSAATPYLLPVPVAALVLGVLVVLDLHAGMAWIPLLAILGAALVSAEIAWTWRRRRQVFGSPHPGIDWYLFALAALALALMLIASRAFWPEHAGAARVIHLHLNLFGFLGLTAVGTLRVLLPTVSNEHDPGTMLFLRRQLPFAVFGTLAIALGAALWPLLAFFGALAWLSPAVALLLALRGNERGWQVPEGAGMSLSAAALGWLLIVIGGIAHGFGALSADKLLHLLLFLFLLPLVTGATSYLLPVWRWPGAATAARSGMRRRLTVLSGFRTAGFWLSALLVMLDVGYAVAPAAVVLASYIVQLSSAFVRVPGNRDPH